MGTLTLLTYVAFLGSMLVSYVVARAQALGATRAVGLMTRPERVIVLAVGLLTGYLMVAVAVIAVLAPLTAVHRLVYGWVTLRKGGLGGVGAGCRRRLHTRCCLGFPFPIVLYLSLEPCLSLCRSLPLAGAAGGGPFDRLRANGGARRVKAAVVGAGPSTGSGRTGEGCFAALASRGVVSAGLS